LQPPVRERDSLANVFVRPIVQLLFLTILVSGCNPCPKVKTLDATASSPALVQILFSAQCYDEPVTGLSSSDITLFEGGEEVSGSESDWSLDRQSAGLETYTLLLIDISKSIIESGTLEVAQSVAVTFSETLLAQNQSVAVAVFDGHTEIRTIVGFSNDLDELTEGIEGISEQDQLDEATNLNGALRLGLEALDTQVAADVEGELISVGNLVVFTDGLDSAGRVSDASARSAVSSTAHQVFVVGLVGQEDVSELSALAPDGFFQADDEGALLAAFEELADQLVAEVNKFYRLSYCSPLRNPRTTLRLEVTWEEKTSSVRFSYPTKDFGAGCELP